MAWKCPQEDRVYRLAYWRTQKDKHLALPASLKVLCCQTSPATAQQAGDPESGLATRQKETPTRRPTNPKSHRRTGSSSNDILVSLPVPNRAMSVHPRPDGTVLVSVPVRRPAWLSPPLSWLMPFSARRRIELDAVGACVLDLCDGRRSVQDLIEAFASRHKLSFREAQLPVRQFLRQLTERGIVAIASQAAAESPDPQP